MSLKEVELCGPSLPELNALLKEKASQALFQSDATFYEAVESFLEHDDAS